MNNIDRKDYFRTFFKSEIKVINLSTIIFSIDRKYKTMLGEKIFIIYIIVDTPLVYFPKNPVLKHHNKI